MIADHRQQSPMNQRSLCLTIISGGKIQMRTSSATIGNHCHRNYTVKFLIVVVVWATVVRTFIGNVAATKGVYTVGGISVSKHTISISSQSSVQVGAFRYFWSIASHIPPQFSLSTFHTVLRPTLKLKACDTWESHVAKNQLWPIILVKKMASGSYILLPLYMGIQF